ncbi:hypothetical protein B0T26DRAFT_711915 [Lasiosphaeria miniovina]|uniref:Uncharacterized protein n=1 Tax=Lasiosphaeria miniovina TaxID=1954250 RepID=A0AA40DZ00_9PEZI|nr:uncharacterized protein B0T26DRAFT_711915 [Lasiosphaeria miniovina]KAK0718116.1 hypothetical protein B0T26DRAFT_711915 [Lasiosphaeria miniovina]
MHRRQTDRQTDGHKGTKPILHLVIITYLQIPTHTHKHSSRIPIRYNHCATKTCHSQKKTRL